MSVLSKHLVGVFAFSAILAAPFLVRTAVADTGTPPRGPAVQASRAVTSVPRPSWQNNSATALAPFLNGRTILDQNGATGGSGQGS